MLAAEGLAIQFGGVAALDGVSIALAAAEIIGIAGPNGAGKSMLLDCIARQVTPHAGTIRFGEVDLLALPPAALPRIGICRTFQSGAGLPSLTVRQQVGIGAAHLFPGSWLGDVLRLPGARRAERAADAAVTVVLEECGLSALADQPVRVLSGAQRKRADLARALAGKPRLLLLDEPAAGADAELRKALRIILRERRERTGMAAIVVEHDLTLLADLCDRVVLLAAGRKVAEGRPSELLAA